jgi:multidrug efflux pump subunit AcrA (membrane-fusion protein)
MRQFMTNRRILRIAFALAAIALVFALPRMVAASRAAPALETGRALPVEVMSAEAAARFTTKRTYTGRLDARRVSALAFERIGLLAKVSVEEGAQVKAGDALAVLDTRALELDRRSAIAERDGAAARLAEMLAALRENPAARNGDVDAVRDVVVRSTRHVIATTLTTIAGFIPLLVDGGAFWPPLAVSVAGGGAGATILALYFVPAAWILMRRQPKPEVQRVAFSAAPATA